MRTASANRGGRRDDRSAGRVGLGRRRPPRATGSGPAAPPRAPRAGPCRSRSRDRLIGEARELLAEEAGDRPPPVLRRAAGPDLEADETTIGAKQSELEPPRAFPVASQMAGSAGHPSAAIAAATVSARLTGSAKRRSAHVGRRLEPGRDRPLGRAQRLVQPARAGRRRTGPRAAPGEAPTRSPMRFNPARPSAAHRPRDRAEGRRSGSPSRAGRTAAGRDPRFGAEPGHRPGCPRGVGEAGADAHPWAASRDDRSARERRLAAEQMRAAGDVEHKPVRRIEPDQRRVAVAPVGDAREQPGVGGEVGGHDGEAGNPGLRLGDSEAGDEPEALRRPVDRDQAQRALDREPRSPAGMVSRQSDPLPRPALCRSHPVRRSGSAA